MARAGAGDSRPTRERDVTEGIVKGQASKPAVAAVLGC